MPAMVACGRRWPIGSDDLVFPGIASLMTRIMVILSLFSALIAYRDSLSCPDTTEVVSVVYAMLALGIIIVILEVFIVIFSARGSIVNFKPRWPVVYLLYIRMGLFCLETVLAIIGTAIAFVDKVSSSSINPACADLSGPTTVLRVLMVLMCLVLVGIIAGILLYVDPCRVCRSRVHYDPHFTDESIFSPQHNAMKDAPQDHWQNHHRVSHTLWERGLKILLCGCNPKIDHHSAYSDVAAIFSRVFCDVNIVPSDIAAVLVLMQRHQLAEEENRRLHWEDMDEEMIRKLLPKFSDSTEYFSKPVDFSKKEDVDTFEAANYYMKYAMATYSWLGYLYYGGSYSCCKLCSIVLKEGCCFQRKRDFVHRDNCCYCNLYGFSGLAGDLLEDDIFYFSLENGICQVPFYIVFDREKQAIVIAIRGTLSLSDVVTDLIGYAEPILMSSSSGGKAHYAHKGILRSAMWLKKRLSDERLLERAFSLEPNYNLVVTGHSLGGGCAALLGVLLKADYPGLRCYTYGTPGALLDINGALYTQSFITTVTVGKDFIGRLSVCTGYLLKHDLLTLASVYNKPKYRILLEGMVETMSRCIGKDYSFPVKSVDFDAAYDSTAFDPTFPSESAHKLNHHISTTPHPPAVTPESSLDSTILTQPVGAPVSTLLPRHLSSRNSLRVGVADSTGFSASAFDEDFSDIEIQEPGAGDSDEEDGNSFTSPLIPGCDEESAIGSSQRHEFASIFQHHLPLFPPGKVIHLREIRQQGQCFLSNRHFEAHWVNNESFQRIIVHPDMLRDHLPTTIIKAMEHVSQELAGTQTLKM